MNRKTFVLLVAVLTLTVGIVVAKLSRPRSQTPKPPDAKPEAAVSNYELSGPYTYENLTIFLIHGPDQPN
ncbi:MAG TPA: hypothetical protein VIF64_13975, partial [Pyrinomonadaceae bacterium]